MLQTLLLLEAVMAEAVAWVAVETVGGKRHKSQVRRHPAWTRPALTSGLL
jgi:hypothetical protein